MENEEKNMIKILSYITKINYNKSEMKLLLHKLIKNLKISFEEKENNIKYENFYFNGLPIPKNINFKDISTNSFKIFWNIEETDLINEVKSKIKYKIEVRLENSNEKLGKFYESNNNNFLVDNLTEGGTYNIRICCSYNNCDGEWSDFQKIKTEIYNCDSVILESSKRKNEFIKRILEWSGFKKIELIYRASKDGSSPKEFHNKCDNQGPTICLYQNDKGFIFGGYAPISWKNSGGWIKNDDSFIFTLTNIHGTEPTKFPHSKGNDSLYHHSDYGATFDDFYITDFKNSDCSLYFPRGHQDILNKGKSIFSGDLNNNNLKVNEIEVFKLYN